MRRASHGLQEITGETLVFKGIEEQKLRYAPIDGKVVLLQGPQTIPLLFSEGHDYIIDYELGTIKRTVQSRIPDWQEHPMYGKAGFDHRDYPDYSNARFTCTIDYSTMAVGKAEAIEEKIKPLLLSQLHERISRQREVTYVVFGDSISTGAEASIKELAYHNRFAAALRNRYPHTEIRVEMMALGGEGSRRGLERIEDIIALQPELVTIGYGMNDQNRQPDGTNSTPLEEFEQNISEMVSRIRQHTSAQIIVITPCLPNPNWIFASENVTDYAEAIRRIGYTSGVVVADVQRLWLDELAAGKTHESLLLNNINHPNDYGHRLYYSALEGLLE